MQCLTCFQRFILTGYRKPCVTHNKTNCCASCALSAVHAHNESGFVCTCWYQVIACSSKLHREYLESLWGATLVYLPPVGLSFWINVVGQDHVHGFEFLRSRWASIVVKENSCSLSNVAVIFLGSIGYHLFMSHSPQKYASWLCHDLRGIAIGATTSTLQTPRNNLLDI